MGDFDIDKIDLWSSILRNYMYFYIFISPIFFKSCIQIELSFIFCKLNDDIILKTNFINLSVFKIAMLNHNQSTYFYIEKMKVFLQTPYVHRRGTTTRVLVVGFNFMCRTMGVVLIGLVRIFKRTKGNYSERLQTVQGRFKTAKHSMHYQ